MLCLLWLKDLDQSDVGVPPVLMVCQNGNLKQECFYWPAGIIILCVDILWKAVPHCIVSTDKSINFALYTIDDVIRF